MSLNQTLLLLLHNLKTWKMPQEVEEDRRQKDRKIETKRLIQGLRISEHIPEHRMKVSRMKSDNSETIFDQNCNLEVSEALSSGCSAFQDAIQYKNRAEIHFHSARFMLFFKIIFVQKISF